jgi:hypothetical protein
LTSPQYSGCETEEIIPHGGEIASDALFPTGKVVFV